MINNCSSRVLRFIGCHPSHPLPKPLILFHSISTLCLSILVTMNIYKEKELLGVESLSIFIFVIVKYLTFVFGHEMIRNLLKSTEIFWPIVPTDSNTRFLFQHLGRVEKMNIFVAVFGLPLYLLKPFVLNKMTIFECYIPEPIPFSVFYIFEGYMVTFFTMTYATTNVVICSLIVAVVVQFRVLNLSLKKIKFVGVESDQDLQACLDELKQKIRYHQFLLRYIESLNKLFSAPTALVIVFGVMVMCMNLYMTFTTIHSTLEQARVLISTSGIICEIFAVFGLPSELLMYESMAIADTIYYECEWYIPEITPLRKDLLIMIMRSQKGSCIRAGNYHVINNQTIVMMFNTTYTFFTALQTMA